MLRRKVKKTSVFRTSDLKIKEKKEPVMLSDRKYNTSPKPVIELLLSSVELLN